MAKEKKRQRESTSQDEEQNKKLKGGNEMATYSLSNLPNELVEEVISFLANNERLSVWWSSKSFQKLMVSNDRLIHQLFAAYARKVKREPSLGSEYFHESYLGGWIIDNYQSYLEDFEYSDQAKRDFDFSELSGFHWATCFGENHSVDYKMVSSCMKEAKLLVPYVSGIYRASCFSAATLHFDTDYFRTYCRLASYNLDAEYDIVNIHSTFNPAELVKARSLNPLENALFKKYEVDGLRLKMDRPERHMSSTKPLIHSLAEFEDRMEQLFYLSKWKHLMDWDSFVLVGGSVLRCLLTDSFEEEGQDIDFFYTGGDYYDCWKFYDKLLLDLRALGYTVEPSDHYYVKVLEVDFGDNKTASFQFIWYDSNLSPDRILQVFDLDCCQVSYNGSEVHGTYAFVQSLCTGTMINYKLLAHSDDLYQFMPRTVKYAHRGFQLLVPHSFQSPLIAKLMDKPFSEVKNELTLDEAKSGSYTGFLLNNDTFEMRMAFARHLFPDVRHTKN